MRAHHIVNILVLYMLVGCASKTNTCDVKSILLDESFFPEKVDSDPIYSPISDDAPQDSATRLFYVGYAGQGVYLGVVEQDVMNFGSSSRASNFFENRVKQSFSTNSSKGPWETPKDATNLVLVADETRLACGMVLGERTCRWHARYATYYLWLRADIPKYGMTESTFIGAVEEIDSRMAQCLDR